MQVYKDFAKGDRVVTGIFTRDYRSNVEHSRVLVTVPECLEILLFTPGHQQWVRKIRYVIFDEIHCMREGAVSDKGNAASRGAVWEHCLLMIRYISLLKQMVVSCAMQIMPGTILPVTCHFDSLV